jgi:hypothetical protein
VPDGRAEGIAVAAAYAGAGAVATGPLLNGAAGAAGAGTPV